MSLSLLLLCLQCVGLLSGLELLLATLDRALELGQADPTIPFLVARVEDPLGLLCRHVLHHLIEGQE